MARRRKERSLGEMISTVCFYLVGVYFVFEGAALRSEGSEVYCAGEVGSAHSPIVAHGPTARIRYPVQFRACVRPARTWASNPGLRLGLTTRPCATHS